eukprot:876414-Prorocentrum_minimum.AAC.4
MGVVAQRIHLLLRVCVRASFLRVRHVFMNFGAFCGAAQMFLESYDFSRLGARDLRHRQPLLKHLHTVLQQRLVEEGFKQGNGTYTPIDALPNARWKRKEKGGSPKDAAHARPN